MGLVEMEQGGLELVAVLGFFEKAAKDNMVEVFEVGGRKASPGKLVGGPAGGDIERRSKRRSIGLPASCS